MGAYERVVFRGKTCDKISRAALLEVERKLGYQLTIVQGMYNPGGVGASGGTHDGGGVVDLSAYDYARKVRVLRSVGWAAWYRPELWRDGKRLWGPHIHAVLIGHAKLAPVAADQVGSYLRGGPGSNGLSDGSVDSGPRQFLNVRFEYPPKRRTPGITAVLQAETLLERKAALGRLVESGSAEVQVIARSYLEAITTYEYNRARRKSLHAKLAELEVR